MTLSCENQQQLFGDQISLEYILSCSNRLNNKNDEIQSMLTRTARIAKVFANIEFNIKKQKKIFFFLKISSQLYELYIKEEEHLKNEWNEICKLFEEKLIEKNERLARKFYQLFKEQTPINYDDVKYFLFKKNEIYFYFFFFSRNYKNRFEHIFQIPMIILIIY
jgi:hypothetical protein